MFAGEIATEPNAAPAHGHADCLVENNSMYFYKSGAMRDNDFLTGSQNPNATDVDQNNRLRFRYGLVEAHAGTSNGRGSRFIESNMGPNFKSSSIIDNKFTRQFYSGSFGFIVHNPTPTLSEADNAVGQTGSMRRYIDATGLGSASRFLSLESINFLNTNNSDTTLTEKDKTELHITFIQGTKDFAPGFNDERSIGTFEIDGAISNNNLKFDEASGSSPVICAGKTPLHHELILKGENDFRFYPTIKTFSDTIRNAHIQAISESVSFSNGCVPATTVISSSLVPGGGSPNQTLQNGLTIDIVKDMQVYIQGGVLGEVGYEGSFTASSGDYGNSLIEDMDLDNYYSGSFAYDVSFLDKDHTLIVNLNKNEELFDGIGEKGLVIIPDHSHPHISFNIEHYLQIAGIMDTNQTTRQNITENIDRND